jgi:hypothetical protein
MNEPRNSRDETNDAPKIGVGKALFSTALFGAIGALVGGFFGKLGEDHIYQGKGLSVLVGRWIGGLGMGGLTAYVTFKEALRKPEPQAAPAEPVARQVETAPPQPVTGVSRVETAQAEHVGQVEAASREVTLV